MILTPSAPSLLPVVQRLKMILQAQGREVRMRLPQAVRTGQEISLAHWTRPMQEAMRPVMQPYWQSGLIQGRREVGQMLLSPTNRFGKSHLLRAKRKDMRFTLGSERMFSLFNPAVLEALDRATFLFCDETNQTATRDLNEAIEALREEFREGLPQGEAYRDLAKRVQELFDDPNRAALIAKNETHRAMNGGAMIAYEKSGSVGALWMTTSRPCPKCEALDGEERPFGEPFYVNPKGGPYAVCMFPPLHVNCECVVAPSIA